MRLVSLEELASVLSLLTEKGVCGCDTMLQKDEAHTHTCTGDCCGLSESKPYPQFEPCEDNERDINLDFYEIRNAKGHFYVCDIEVPGLLKEEIEIDIDENNVLHITGKEHKKTEESIIWYVTHRNKGKLALDFKFPPNGDLERISISITDSNILRLSCPLILQNIAEDTNKKRIVIV